MSREKRFRKVLRPRITLSSSAMNVIDNKNYEHYMKECFLGSLWCSWDKSLRDCGDRKYKGNFLPGIVKNSLLRYTRSHDLVVDCFAGSGTTIDVCKKFNRECVATDLNPIRADIIEADAAEFNYPICDHVIMHPPYAGVIRYSTREKDLSNVQDGFEFLLMLETVIKNVSASLKKKRFLTFVIGDYFLKGKYVPLSFLCISLFEKYGFILKAICVKNCDDIRNNNKTYKLWCYRNLKYGLYFWQHEYIMFFKK